MKSVRANVPPQWVHGPLSSTARSRALTRPTPSAHFSEQQKEKPDETVLGLALQARYFTLGMRLFYPGKIAQRRMPGQLSCPRNCRENRDVVLEEVLVAPPVVGNPRVKNAVTSRVDFIHLPCIRVRGVLEIDTPWREGEGEALLLASLGLPEDVEELLSRLPGHLHIERLGVIFDDEQLATVRV